MSIKIYIKIRTSKDFLTLIFVRLMNRIHRVFSPRSFDLNATRRRGCIESGVITTLSNVRRGISYTVLTAYESVFEKFGFFLARRPLAVLLASLIFLAACCMGFIRVSVEPPTSEQFTVIDSQSRLDLRHAAQFFSLLEAHKE